MGALPGGLRGAERVWSEPSIWLMVSSCVPQVLFSKKYGISNIRFTHNINCVIYSSTKVRWTMIRKS